MNISSVSRVQASRNYNRRPSGSAGFTLVELLVVIAIIAVLIAVLLPVLASARKQADKVKCLAALKEMGSAYGMYAVDNQGWWPVTRHVYYKDDAIGGTVLEKRWHDFIGKYLNYGRLVNADGTNVASAAQDTIGSIKDKGTLLWSCPVWNLAYYGGAGPCRTTAMS